MSLVPFQRLARNVQEHFFKKPPLANDVEVCVCVFVILLLFFNYDHMFFLVYEYWGGGGIEECCGSLEACSKKYLRNGCRYFKPSSMNIIFFFIVIILVIVFSGNSGSLFIIATTIFLFTVEV